MPSVENMEPLLRAAVLGDLTSVKHLLRSGSCDVNIRDDRCFGFTPLHHACA